VLVSYVLRLVDKELANGRVVGEVEAVGTGEHRAVGNIEELVSFCVETGVSGGRPTS
jgi:hypothetical protein